LIYAAIWPQLIWAENWGLCPLGEGSWVPSNTMWPGPRPTCTPSFILIRQTVWPQHAYTNVTDRQDRQRSDSMANRFTNGRPKTKKRLKFRSTLLTKATL